MPRRSYRFICLPLFVLMLLASVATLSAQTTDDIGGFNRQYWDKGDNGASGAYIISGFDNNNNFVSILPDSDIFTFSTAQKASIDRAFDYWGDVLGLGIADGMSPVIRVVGQDITDTNANADSFSDTDVFAGNAVSRIINGNDPDRF